MGASTKSSGGRRGRRGRKRSETAPKFDGKEQQDCMVHHAKADAKCEEPIIESNSMLIETVEKSQTLNRKLFWPKGEELPTHYRKPRPLPCPRCLRVRLDSLGQCCVVRGFSGSIAYMRCRSCSHLWAMPVR